MSLDANANVTLKNLIDAGADAAPNLFYVSIQKEQESSADTGDADSALDAVNGSKEWAPPCRVQNVSPPGISQSKTQLSWQNTQVPILTPGFSDLTKDIAFDFRLDSNYNLYQKLLNSFDADVNGTIKSNDESISKYSPSSFLIKVYVLKPSSDLSNNSTLWGYNSVVNIWEFAGCKLYKIPRINLSYNNTSPVVISASFIYKTVKLYNSTDREVYSQNI